MAAAIKYQGLANQQVCVGEGIHREKMSYMVQTHHSFTRQVPVYSKLPLTVSASSGHKRRIREIASVCNQTSGGILKCV
jgi:hypothetical protein